MKNTTPKKPNRKAKEAIEAGGYLKKSPSATVRSLAPEPRICPSRLPTIFYIDECKARLKKIDTAKTPLKGRKAKHIPKTLMPDPHDANIVLDLGKAINLANEQKESSYFYRKRIAKWLNIFELHSRNKPSKRTSRRIFQAL